MFFFVSGGVAEVILWYQINILKSAVAYQHFTQLCSNRQKYFTCENSTPFLKFTHKILILYVCMCYFLLCFLGYNLILFFLCKMFKPEADRVAKNCYLKTVQFQRIGTVTHRPPPNHVLPTQHCGVNAFFLLNNPHRTGYRTDPRRLRDQSHRNDDRHHRSDPGIHFRLRDHAADTFPLRRPRS